MLLSLIRMIQAFRDYQRNVAELSQLSDRELSTSARPLDIPRCRRHLQRLILHQPSSERITPASLRAFDQPQFQMQRGENALTVRDDCDQILFPGSYVGAARRFGGRLADRQRRNSRRRA
jgi:hypothetical protein